MALLIVVKEVPDSKNLLFFSISLLILTIHLLECLEDSTKVEHSKPEKDSNTFVKPEEVFLVEGHEIIHHFGRIVLRKLLNELLEMVVELLLNSIERGSDAGVHLREVNDMLICLFSFLVNLCVDCSDPLCREHSSCHNGDVDLEVYLGAQLVKFRLQRDILFFEAVKSFRKRHALISFDIEDMELFERLVPSPTSKAHDALCMLDCHLKELI